MDLSLSGLLREVPRALTSPRESAQAVLSLGLALQERWLALFLTAVLSAIATTLSFGLLMAGMPDAPAPSPWTLAVSQVGAMVLTALAVHQVGRWRGGQGDLGGAVILVAWLQFILLCLQLVQVAAILLVPAAASAVGLAGIVVFFWLLTVFVAELHGFRSLGLVLVAIVMTMLAVAFLMSFVLVIFIGPMA